MNNNNKRDDLVIPPLPRSLQLCKEWETPANVDITNFYPPIAPLEPPRSLFDPQYTAMCCGISSTDEFTSLPGLNNAICHQ
uniref:Uncharacterized protein n=1 Tax=Globodera pallida TaxID=36090 RepID=A0A183CQV5_GLOPA